MRKDVTFELSIYLKFESCRHVGLVGGWGSTTVTSQLHCRQRFNFTSISPPKSEVELGMH